MRNNGKQWEIKRHIIASHNITLIITTQYIIKSFISLQGNHVSEHNSGIHHCHHIVMLSYPSYHIGEVGNVWNDKKPCQNEHVKESDA